VKTGNESDGMKAIVECKMKNHTSIKKMKNNRKQDTSNRKCKEICFEVQATALCPRLHHYEGFHYPLRDLPQKDYNLVYTRPEYTTPPIQPSTQEVAQSQFEVTKHLVIYQDHKHSLL